MGYRFMRLMVFFDLPTVTKIDLKTYTQFRKFLIKEGFVMMQESVYTKILLNGTMAELMMARLLKEIPKKGLVQTLLVTEKQFTNIKYLSGNKQNIINDSDERLVVY
ncbi:MAG: CRISPR-associated endonuclease Cas2 [Clostridia bacterium]|nr:CRISPR-associated endonuclease Cas2 [Clostridia bacterium]